MTRNYYVVVTRIINPTIHNLSEESSLSPSHSFVKGHNRSAENTRKLLEDSVNEYSCQEGFFSIDVLDRSSERISEKSPLVARYLTDRASTFFHALKNVETTSSSNEVRAFKPIPINVGEDGSIYLNRDKVPRQQEQYLYFD